MSEPKRVAQIVGKWVGGGVEAVIMNYYRNIDKSKIQFDFLCDSDSTNIPYEEIETLGGKVILIPPYQKPFKYHKELKKILKENKYEIVHSHINTMSVFPLFAAWCAKVPRRIAHSHSTTNKAEWKKNIVKLILRPWTKLFANEYMCCTEYAGRWMFGNKKFDKGQVYVLNNAIDLNKFKYDQDVRNDLRKQYNISNDTLVIGHIGRFMKQKNHDFIIDVFNELVKKNDDSILMLVGQGPLMDEIKAKVNNLGLENKVIFVGQVTNPNDYYQAFDLFLFPSLYEGLGMVAVEAQVAGLPCVCSTEVPIVAKICDDCKFLSLEDNKNNWVNKILNVIDKNNRTSCDNEAKNFGFDIVNEVNKLEKKYLGE